MRGHYQKVSTGDEAAHVAVFPGENRGIVLVTHARQAVHVVEDGVDVMLKGRDESWIGEKIHGVLFLFPCKKLAYAAECAGCASAQQSDDNPHFVLASGEQRIVRGR